MADITKCTSVDCPQRNKCWRHFVTDSYMQSCQNFYETKKREPCEYFYPLHTKAGGISLITKFNNQIKKNVKK